MCCFLQLELGTTPRFCRHSRMISLKHARDRCRSRLGYLLNRHLSQLNRPIRRAARFVIGRGSLEAALGLLNLTGLRPRLSHDYLVARVETVGDNVVDLCRRTIRLIAKDVQVHRARLAHIVTLGGFKYVHGSHISRHILSNLTL